jgi:hypothetical protein
VTAYSVETARLRAMGYTCRLEAIRGQGYCGGDGISCYRVRSPEGVLANYAVSTHRTARAAWAEAVLIEKEERSWRPRGYPSAKEKQR